MEPAPMHPPKVMHREPAPLGVDPLVGNDLGQPVSVPLLGPPVQKVVSPGAVDLLDRRRVHRAGGYRRSRLGELAPLSSRPQPPVAAGAAPGEDGKTAYALLRNSWIVRRAGIESTILTYFPKVDSCWYSYELAISDFISLSADNNARSTERRA